MLQHINAVHTPHMVLLEVFIKIETEERLLEMIPMVRILFYLFFYYSSLPLILGHLPSYIFTFPLGKNHSIRKCGKKT